jgi:hypothetical protein
MTHMPGNIYFKTVADAYLDYKLYCKDAGQNYPLGRNNFVKRMEGLVSYQPSLYIF